MHFFPSEVFYRHLTADSDVEIQHPLRSKGKGTFSRKDFRFGEVVFTEEPLGYFRSVGEAVCLSLLSSPFRPLSEHLCLTSPWIEYRKIVRRVLFVSEPSRRGSHLSHNLSSSKRS